jgi:hypothetical protein
MVACVDKFEHGKHRDMPFVTTAFSTKRETEIGDLLRSFRRVKNYRKPTEQTGVVRIPPTDGILK